MTATPKPVDPAHARRGASELERATPAEITEPRTAHHGEDDPTVSPTPEYDARSGGGNMAIEQTSPNMVRKTALRSGSVARRSRRKFAKVRHKVPMLFSTHAFSDQDAIETCRA